MSEIENLKIGNGGTLHIVGNEDIIANEWEAGQVYIENRSYVIREHKLLMCNTTHTSVEPFDPDKWTEKNIGEALGTAGSANMIECTLAEYNAWKAGGQLINETVYVITDAPNLNATAKDISYEGSTDTVWDKVEAKQDALSVTDNNLSVATYGGTIYYRKYGKIVEVTGTGIGQTTEIPANAEPTLVTLPSGFRPKRAVTVLGFRQNSFNYNRMLGYTINTNGNIVVYAYDPINNGRFTCTYIVD